MNTIAELVFSATSDRLDEMDWAKNIEICELVARDHSEAKDVLKAIKESLGSEKANTQLYAMMLLEMLINNIGEPVHKHVVDTAILPLLVQLAIEKSGSVREKIFLLLDAAQSSVGGASGKFPEYYSAYHELVSAGIQFPERPHGVPKPRSTSDVNTRRKKFIARERENDNSELSIIQKAETALEVLRDVLNTIDGQHPEAFTISAKDEFTLDLVEQCSFHKQRITHLAVTSSDRETIARAFELNEELYSVLHRHGALIAQMSTSDQVDHEQEEDEEEAEQVLRRMRKGKTCLGPQDEDEMNRQRSLMSCSIPGNIINRPIIRPLSVERELDSVRHQNVDELTEEAVRPLSSELEEAESADKSAIAIPPPPAKHAERKEFFRNKNDEDSGLDGHMKNLSLDGRNAS